MIQGIIVVAISLHWQPGGRGGGEVGRGWRGGVAETDTSHVSLSRFPTGL